MWTKYFRHISRKSLSFAEKQADHVIDKKYTLDSKQVDKLTIQLPDNNVASYVTKYLNVSRR